MDIVIPPLGVSFQATDGSVAFELRVPSLRLAIGSICFLLGHNGSGKSVFLKLLTRELQANGEHQQLMIGDKILLPHDVSLVRQRAEHSLAQDLRVSENILIRLRSWRMLHKLFPRRRQNEALKILSVHKELLRKADEQCWTLSEGQKQALAFLAATAPKCHLLLLDEFVAAADVSTSRMLMALASDYARDHSAVVIIVSHDLSLALTSAQRILVLRQGTLAADLRRGDARWTLIELEKLLFAISEQTVIATHRDLKTPNFP